MNRRLLIVVLALGLGPGCDVATVALLMSSQDDGSDDDSPLAAPPPGFLEPVFNAWIAQIADAAAADAQHAALITAGGNPDRIPSSVWTFLGDFTATEIFDPVADPASFNAILIQASSTQNYDIDCVEILDAQSVVTGHASGTTWWNLVEDADLITGPPDGASLTTTAIDTDRSFIFTLYSIPIDRFRINAHPPADPAPGDVIGSGAYPSPSAERPGGLAVRASDGMIHVTLSVGDVGRLVRFSEDGLFEDHVEMASDLATVGSHSVALNSDGVIFTAASTLNGVIQILRFESDLTLSGSNGASSGLGNDRVEHNSIALDGVGNVIVVGGFSTLLSGRNHWRIKLPDTVTGSAIWQSSASLDNANDTDWHAVTSGANDEIFTTGNLFDGALLGGTNLIYSTRYNSSGVATWTDDYSDGDVPSDVGHAIALDAGGNIYVAGSAGTDSNGLDRVLLRYNSLGNLTGDADFSLGATGNDEILDIAIDSDGAIYVVGYVTVTGQGENIWIRKYTFNGGFVQSWERTHHGGFGNDRAISCAIHGSTLVVAGYETNSTGQTKLVLRMYEK